MTSAFFAVSGSSFVSSEHTRGPWNDAHQHAGPPSALLGRAFETFAPRPDARIVRVTTEILRPIPIVPLEIDVSLARGGRNVELLEAVLVAEGREVLRARAWRMRTTATDIPASERTPMPGPERGVQTPFFPTFADVGYHTSMEWRFVTGGFNEPGPGSAWLRMTMPLVEGEDPSALVRALIAADSGNGVSAALDYQRYLFVNTDLTVQLYRDAVGEWLGLDSRSHVEPTGVGITETVLHDRGGPIGRALQTLFVVAR
jgi:hypothetical protein